ncbi:MAG: hypothetical protein ACR2H6_07900 [Pyrinomonadaceae bacterium]
MNFGLVEKVADAVLYEGYILYPYRPSAVKNQQRWNFGALCPASYSVAQNGTEAYSMQTECLFKGSAETSLDIKVRFLHLVTRSVAKTVAECERALSDCGHRQFVEEVPALHFQVVPALEVNGKAWLSWDEAVEREVLLADLKPDDLFARPYRHNFSFSESETVERLDDEASGKTVGVSIRRQETIAGVIEVSIVRLDHAAPTGDQPIKLTVRVSNKTPFENATERNRNEALLRSPVSTHTILNVRSGEFYSLLDPPEALRGAAAGCRNIGTYPVLVGDEGVRDCMLSSPIILYDYPQIAPESAGNLFDGTEIDEILTLRIMTLTEEEKREIRGADDRARQILERTEALPAEQLMKMHGAMKGVGRKA